MDSSLILLAVITLFIVFYLDFLAGKLVKSRTPKTPLECCKSMPREANFCGICSRKLKNVEVTIRDI